MPTPFQTETYYDCTTCKLRPFRHFCNLQMDQVEALQLVKKTLVFPPDAVVFNEGDVPEGVFILCSGRVKLFSATQHGKIFILKIARPGELLGLNATIMDRPYLVSAETVEPCQINFVPRDAFLQYIAECNEASTHVIEQLADNYYAAQREIQSLGLAQSARQKLARLLVDWSHATEQTKGEIWLRFYLTHEEIAQMIGTSRETVTRLLTEFTRKKLLHVEGNALAITNLSGLEALARRRGTFRSTVQLETAIKSYLRLYNEEPKPFIWHKTADQILESVGRFCQRTSDSGH